MPTFSFRLALVAIAFVLAAASGAAAQSFSVSLGSRVLGTLSYDAASSRLSSVLDNTPLGVGDGTFEGTSRAVRTDAGETVTQYIGRSDDRVISVLLDGGRALETVVSPTSEATALSDAASVPTAILDPVAGFGRIVSSDGCPAPLRLYDGRRVIEIRTESETATADLLSCALDYRVVAGPGHLSPFRFTSIDVALEYGLAGGGQSLQSVAISAGTFTVTLTR